MSKLIWYILFVSLPFSVLGIDLSRLYGHLRPPPQKRSGKCLILINYFSIPAYVCHLHGQLSHVLWGRSATFDSHSIKYLFANAWQVAVLHLQYFNYIHIYTSIDDFKIKFKVYMTELNWSAFPITLEFIRVKNNNVGKVWSEAYWVWSVLPRTRHGEAWTRTVHYIIQWIETIGNL